MESHIPSRRRTLHFATAALCFALVPASSTSAELKPPSGLSAPAKPTAMPAFELPTTAGTTLRSESLKGQVLVVRFWASW